MYIESTADLRDLLIARIHEHDEAESEEAVAAIAALEGATTMQGLRDAVAALDSDLNPNTIFESDEVQDEILQAAEQAASAHDSDSFEAWVVRDGLDYTIHKRVLERCCGQDGWVTSERVAPVQCGSCGTLSWADSRTVTLSEPDDVAGLLEAAETVGADQEEEHEADVRGAGDAIFDDAHAACMGAIDDASTVEEAEGAIATFIDDWSGGWDWSSYPAMTEEELEDVISDVDHELANDAELQARVEERVAELTAAAG